MNTVVLAVFVINGASILAILVRNRVWFLHSGLELIMFFSRSYFFIIIDNTINKRATVPIATEKIGYQSFGQVINSAGKITDFGH